MSFVRIVSILLYSAVFLLAAPCSSFAQESPHAAPGMNDTQKIKSLRAIQQSLENIRSDIRKNQDALDSTEGLGRQGDIEEQIRKLDSQRESLERNFSEISSGIDVSVFGIEKGKIELNWQKEVLTLLGPLVNELKRLTSGPREMAFYRSQIEELEEKQQLISTALDNISTLKQESKKPDPLLLNGLENEFARWKDRALQIETQLEIFRQKLNKKLKERTSVIDSVKSIPALFFKSRGRNLLIAFLTTLIFCLVLRRIQHIINFSLQSTGKGQSFRYRLFSVIYLFFTGIGSVFVFLTVLFFFGDWVLLVIGGMFLLGLLWSSRQAIPKFWNQAVLLLNLGPVREGERVVYKGLPWRVSAIGFYTSMENPQLDGGLLKLPLKDIAEMRSRPSGKNEFWFPTTQGDWIIVNEKFGKIVHQGVDLVRLQLPGSAVVTYPTLDFLGLKPTVLSNGYRISLTFGVDYRHQQYVTDVICGALVEDIQNGLVESLCTKSQVTTRVEFQSAAESSLELYLCCDFTGELAPLYERLKRAIATLAVESCNRRGWTIPFPQLTVHMAQSDEAA